MRSFYQGLWRRLAINALSLATAGFAASCQQLAEPQPDVGSVGGTPASQQSPIAVTQQAQATEQACGFPTCEADLLAKGTASISGVPSVDAFFQSVLDFQTKSTAVSGEIDAQLAAIRADFDIAASADLEAQLKAQIKAHAEALTIEAEPARCAVDVQASLQAQAKCDVTVDPGKATVECKGSCEVDASADVKCDASADLQCTLVAPSIVCMGQCKGSCDATLTAAAECSGTCTGDCDGTCSAYGGGGQCAGTCSGKCKGSCKTELAAEAKCDGKCEGECTTTKPSGGCEGGIRAECKAKAMAMVSCNGRCTGDFEPPSASAECEANARAQAKLNVECTPPRLAVHFEPKLTVGLSALDLKAQLRFVAAVKNLEVRLPALIAAIERAKSVGAAYTELTGKGKDAIQAAANASADGSLRVRFGLVCAAKQLGGVAALLKTSNTNLTDSIAASAKLKSALAL